MSHPIPPAQMPYELRELLKDPKILEFFDKWLRSTYFLWAGFEKNVGFYGVEPVAQGAALTASDTNTPNSGDATTDAIIANLQTRVDELEARLTSVGLIE